MSQRTREHMYPLKSGSTEERKRKDGLSARFLPREGAPGIASGSSGRSTRHFSRSSPLTPSLSASTTSSATNPPRMRSWSAVTGRDGDRTAAETRHGNLPACERGFAHGQNSKRHFPSLRRPAAGSAGRAAGPDSRSGTAGQEADRIRLGRALSRSGAERHPQHGEEAFRRRSSSGCGSGTTPSTRARGTRRSSSRNSTTSPPSSGRRSRTTSSAFTRPTTGRWIGSTTSSGRASRRTCG